MPTLDLTLIICLQGLESKVSLTLDCWTSSNQWAFICIIMTYVTDDWELEEVILDFREIVGEHSGENLAEVVWQTIAAYGLENKVCQNGIMRLDLRNAKLRALSSRLFLLWLTMHQTMIHWSRTWQTILGGNLGSKLMFSALHISSISLLRYNSLLFYIFY